MSLSTLYSHDNSSLRCVITYTPNTEKEDFYGEGAAAKLPSLAGVSLEDIFRPLVLANSGSNEEVSELVQ